MNFWDLLKGLELITKNLVLHYYINIMVNSSLVKVTKMNYINFFVSFRIMDHFINLHNK